MRASNFLLAATLPAIIATWNAPVSLCCAADPAVAAEKPAGASQGVGERVPSEDAVIKDFHSLGLINGHTNIFRCASPVKDLVESAAAQSDRDGASETAAQAKARMKRFYDLGIHTVVSFENPNQVDPKDGVTSEEKLKRVQATVALEKKAAAEAGLTYISHSIANSGKNSLEDMSDAEVVKLLDPICEDIFKHAQDGGVVFHCSAGHDRTGIVAAYIRLKYQHWPVEEAIDEMRRYGHNWPKFSHDAGVTSWHEDHLRAIVKQLSNQAP